MNCIEFRRCLGSDPLSRAGDFLAHLELCPGCAAAHAKAVLFERELRGALSVAAPQGLEERILLRQLTAARHTRAEQRRAGWLQLAAAVFLVAGGIGIWQWRAQQIPFDQRLVEHLDHEAFATSLMNPVPRDQIEGAFRRMNVAVPAELGNITFVAVCRENGKRFLHFVEQTPDGTYTVMVTPAVEFEPRAFEHQGHHAYSRRLAQQTMLTVIGESARDAAQTATRWLRAWSISNESVGSK